MLEESPHAASRFCQLMAWNTGTALSRCSSKRVSVSIERPSLGQHLLGESPHHTSRPCHPMARNTGTTPGKLMVYTGDVSCVRPYPQREQHASGGWCSRRALRSEQLVEEGAHTWPLSALSMHLAHASYRVQNVAESQSYRVQDLTVNFTRVQSQQPLGLPIPRQPVQCSVTSHPIATFAVPASPNPFVLQMRRARPSMAARPP